MLLTLLVKCFCTKFAQFFLSICDKHGHYKGITNAVDDISDNKKLLESDKPTSVVSERRIYHACQAAISELSDQICCEIFLHVANKIGSFISHGSWSFPYVFPQLNL